MQQYIVAGGLIVLGVLLWVVTWLINRQLGIRAPGITDPMHLAEPPD